MLPMPMFSVTQLLLMLAPFLAMALTAYLLLSLGVWAWGRRCARRQGRPQARFWRRSRILLGLLALAGNLWGGVLWWQLQQWHAESVLQSHYQHSRRRFVLPQDLRHGELLVPQGSLVNSYDVFDNGEPQRALTLRGVQTVRFAHPLQIAGAWASAMDAREPLLELDRDQRLGPLYHFNADGAWAPLPGPVWLDCRRGQLAVYSAPLIDYDIRAEFAHPEPDGPLARFRPSEWTLSECRDQPEGLVVEAAYAEPGPAGANPQVFGPAVPYVAPQPSHDDYGQPLPTP